MGHLASVISVFIDRALKGAEIPIEGDGLQTRDFTFVEDVVECNLLAATSPRAKGEVYNVGTGTRTSVIELADTILGLTGSSSEKVFLPPRTGDVRHSVADITKAREHLGYRPKTDITEGLRKTIEWVRSSARGS